ncbi:Tfp pilus assembly protein PilO [Desulfitispora alkaliphila]|uniref:hypothetical protein n=1 Tax=Desulfitispora alkaliphila TaxID=622674 RepID=UPI003D19F970
MQLAKIPMTLTKRDKRILTAVGIIFFILCAYWLIFKQYLPYQEQLVAEVDQAQSRLQQLHQDANAIPVLEEQRDKLDQELSMAMRPFSWRVDKGDPLLVLGQKELTESFPMRAIAQGETLDLEYTMGTSYYVTYQGKQEGLLNLLTYLDRLEQSLLLERVEINNLFEPHQEGLADKIRMEIDLIAFGLKDTSQVRFIAPPIEAYSAKDNLFLPHIAFPVIEEAEEGTTESSTGNSGSHPVPENYQELIQEPRYHFPREGELMP